MTTKTSTDRTYKSIDKSILLLAVVLVVVWLFFAIVVPEIWLDFRVLAGYINISSLFGILAIAVALLMIDGEIDLSIGSLIGFSSLITAWLSVDYEFSLIISAIISLIVVMGVGLLNGLLVTKLRPPSFLITLGTGLLLFGLNNVILYQQSGRIFILDDPDIQTVRMILNSNISVGGVIFRASILWWFLLAALAIIFLRRVDVKSWFGKDKSKRYLFLGTAFSSWLVATIQLTNTRAADGFLGSQLEIIAIIAVIIGGVFRTRGYDLIIGTMLGALMLGMVRQGVFMAGFANGWFQVFAGVIFLSVLIMYRHKFLRWSKSIQATYISENNDRTIGKSFIQDSAQQVPNVNIKSSDESARAKMTKNFTNEMAALFINERNFPTIENLPAIQPPPFNNFGHQVFLDYKLLVKIISQVLEEICASFDEIYGGKNILSIGLGIAVTAITLLFGVPFVQSGSAWPIVLSPILGIIAYYLSDNRNKRAKEKLDSIRAEAIEKLISGNWNLQLDTEIEDQLNHYLNLVGDGSLGGDHLPVLIIYNNNHPFPGYGPLQAENLFVTKPKQIEDENTLPVPLSEVRQTIRESIINIISEIETTEVSFGDVVIIHGNSLFIDSPWLNENSKIPRLWFEKEKLAEVESIDQRASVRTYFATQIVFPQYRTAATFFVRVFMAGNSASCQIALTTIGPLIYPDSYFRRRLLKYQIEKDDDRSNDIIKNSISVRMKRQILKLRLIPQQTEEFKTSLINFSSLKDIDLFEEDEEMEEYEKEIQKTIDESVVWPGLYVAEQNLRELYSLDFTNDFFGRTEAIASVKTLYDQIARTILDGLDDLGFDVSPYRDNEGNYSINADKIDQLVLGERIQISKSNDSSSKEGKKSEATEKLTSE